METLPADDSVTAITLRRIREEIEAPLRAEIARLRSALEDIKEGKGAYSRDQYEFACNVIESAKKTAQAALDGTYEIN